jgi:hypothetical protein
MGEEPGLPANGLGAANLTIPLYKVLRGPEPVPEVYSVDVVEAEEE